MHNQSYVFAQLASHLDRSKFNYLVRKCQGDSYIKVFSCWNQLKVLMFGQLSRRESLRNLIVAVEAHSAKAKSLVFGNSVTRSNLAKANQNRDVVFITNAMDITALEVALLYKNRWPIELFFKWVKQHLKIKKFWEDSENAVRIQIYTAIISYCLVVIVHHRMQLKTSAYNALQILGISLTDTTPLEDLFNKSNLNINKELDGFYEPTLFDY